VIIGALGCHSQSHDLDNNNNNNNKKTTTTKNNNNNNNIQDNVYGAVIMAEPLREFTQFI